MKFFTVISLGIILFASTAKADLTNNDLQKFFNNYVASYKSCNLNETISYIQKSYSPNYSLKLQMPNGQTQEINKKQFINMTKQSIQSMRQANANMKDCTPNMNILETKINGNSAKIKIIQKERAQMQGANGRIINIGIDTLCNHMMNKEENSVIISESYCVVSQN